jgi:ribosomal protein L37AE/L43A
MAAVEQVSTSSAKQNLRKPRHPRPAQSVCDVCSESFVHRPPQATAMWTCADKSKGNIALDVNTAYTKPEDLITPTIKSNTYTTGRGGQGNMAKNDNPDNARLAQDVDGPVKISEPKGIVHYGRGGAANIITDQERQSGDAKRNESGASAEQGLLSKVKGLFK